MASPSGLPVPSQPPAEVETVTSLLSSALLQDPKFLAACLAVLLSLVAWYSFGKSSGSKKLPAGTPTVLLAGVSDAGKTTIFSKLALSQTTPTIPSLKTSTSTFLLPSTNKPIQLIDVPGHSRLRDQLKEKMSEGGVKAVVFVVDVKALEKNVAGVAEALPPILTALVASSINSTSSSSPPQLLLLAHKADLLGRSTSTSLDTRTHDLALSKLKTTLTSEMTRLKASRSTLSGKIESISAIQSTGSIGAWASFLQLIGLSSGKRVVLGDNINEEDLEALIWGGKGAFRWEDVEGVEIEFGVSGLSGLSKELKELQEKLGKKPGEDEGERSEELDEKSEVVGDDGLDELRDWLERL